jgi:hypothetical protein
MAYAEGTLVAAEKSRSEIEALVQKYAGRDADFTYGKSCGQAGISFVAKARRVQFMLPLPTMEEAKQEARDRRAPSRAPSPARCEEWLEKETRRRWRCLLLIIKAKFAAVEIWEELGQGDAAKTAFDREFLSHIVSQDGKTIWDTITSMPGQKLLTAAPDADSKKSR